MGNMSYFYGPVPSRRLGFSLGVDLLPPKTCSFDCLYCQLGKSKTKSIKRFSWVDLSRFKKELKAIINRGVEIDYITISGSGEPTLHKGLDKIISVIKHATKKRYPVCVITNSSLLYRKDVRKELKAADVIIPSLDAASAKTFHRVNKPHKKITFSKVIQGLEHLRREFKGSIWLEIMLLGGVNDNLKEARRFKKIIERIKPDKIQLNLPVRPSFYKVSLPKFRVLKKIKEIIEGNVEVVENFPAVKQRRFSRKIKNEILEFLKRRPADLENLACFLGLNKNETIKHLQPLLAKKTIKMRISKGKRYFVVND